jgi:anti-sigma factor RsiW
MNLDAQLKLQAWLDDELPEREAAEVKDWVARDPEAQALLAELKNTVGPLKDFEAGIKVPETREFYWSKIERVIERQEKPAMVPESASWLMPFLRRFAPIGVVAALVALILVAKPSTASSLAAEMEVSDSDVNAYTYRDQKDGLTMIWFYDRQPASEFTPETVPDKVPDR